MGRFFLFVSRFSSSSSSCRRRPSSRSSVVIEVRGHGGILVLGRHGVVQRHLEPLALGPAVLEPKLHVLGLEPGELLPVRHAVQLVRVLGDQAVRRMRVVLEPLFEPGHLAHRVDERPVPFPAFLGQCRQIQTASRSSRRHLSTRNATVRNYFFRRIKKISKKKAAAVLPLSRPRRTLPERSNF